MNCRKLYNQTSDGYYCHEDCFEDNYNKLSDQTLGGYCYQIDTNDRNIYSCHEDYFEDNYQECYTCKTKICIFCAKSRLCNWLSKDTWECDKCHGINYSLCWTP